jgi:transcriptional regulator with XRE-family HTH domain
MSPKSLARCRKWDGPILGPLGNAIACAIDPDTGSDNISSIADQTGISHATLSRFIAGKTNLSGNNLNALAAHFGLILVPVAMAVTGSLGKPSATARRKRPPATRRTSRTSPRR